MSYLPFARKWRPQVFEDLVGQGHITATLKNAIVQERVAHAYLFSGPRGIGKTSCARIFAKALNCEKGPLPVPCNECFSCKEISAGNSMDVLEIDGASNRGIDEVRELRENVKFAPSQGIYKIYIIDEVHMLTAEAFNALLKTLEEPPAHIKFIFATTQPHKILNTIVSRCQRFDFRRISTKDIVGQLKEILAAEKIEAQEEVLLVIARVSDGSLRDAESILDQLVSFCGPKIEIEGVMKLLGLIGQDFLFETVEALIKKDAKALLLLVERLMREGRDAGEFISALIEHFRNILVAKLSGALDFPEEDIKHFSKQANYFSVEEIGEIFEVLSNTVRLLKNASLPRIPLEMALVKLALMRRGSVGNFNVAGGFSPAATKTNVKNESAIIVQQKQGAGNLRGASVRTNKCEHVCERRRDGEAGRNFLLPKPDKECSVRDGQEEISLGSNFSEHGSAKDKKEKLLNAPQVTLPPASAETLSLDAVQSKWREVVDAVKKEKMTAGLYLSEGRPAAVNGRRITVLFPEVYRFHKENLENMDNKRLIDEILNDILGEGVNSYFVLDEKSEVLAEAGAAPEKTDDPLINQALKLFNGKMVK